MSKKQPISIYLLRDGKVPKDIIANGRLRDYDEINGAKYYLKNDCPKIPNWAEYLKLEDIKTRSASCIVFVPFKINANNKKRWAALSFGYAYSLLKNNENIQDDFGTITGLNMLDSQGLRSSDMFEPSDLGKSKRVRTAKETNLRFLEFGRHQNLLKSATGRTTSDHETWVNKITFTENHIKLQLNSSIQNLQNELAKIYSIYEEKYYKKNFPEVFDLRPITESMLIAKLASILARKITERDEYLYLTFPEDINNNEASKFCIRIHNNSKLLSYYDNLGINDLYNFLDEHNIEIKDMKQLDEIIIDQLSETGDAVNSRRAYSCLLSDADYHKNSYYLYDSKWYQLNKEARSLIELSIASHKSKYIFKEKDIIEFDKSKLKGMNLENAYNCQLSRHIDGILLDGKNIWYGQRHQVEPCDILLCHPENNYNIFIHVKRIKGSKPISHLLDQGINSLELLKKQDEKFLRTIKEFDDRNRFCLKRKTRIHYIIITKSAMDELPFFAQMALNSAIKNILSMGVEVVYSIVGGDE